MTSSQIFVASQRTASPQCQLWVPTKLFLPRLCVMFDLSLLSLLSHIYQRFCLSSTNVSVALSGPAGELWPGLLSTALSDHAMMLGQPASQPARPLARLYKSPNMFGLLSFPGGRAAWEVGTRYPSQARDWLGKNLLFSLYMIRNIIYQLRSRTWWTLLSIKGVSIRCTYTGLDPQRNFYLIKIKTPADPRIRQSQRCQVEPLTTIMCSFKCL